MTSARPHRERRHERHGIPGWVPRSARGRLLLSALIAVLVGVGVPWSQIYLRFLAAWNAGALTLIGFAWGIIATASAAESRARAAAQDPGRLAVHLVVLASSTLNLFTSVALLRGHGDTPSSVTLAWGALSLASVTSSWFLCHTSWALRYAHLYYRDDGSGPGGVEFPKSHSPTDFDFAYFAFTIGMCFQVSDVVITSTLLRRAVLAHAVQSFAFNTAILALALNVAIGLIS